MSVADTFPNGLFPNQLVGALEIQQVRRKLLADQPGAGKTAQALVALELDHAFDMPANGIPKATLILCNVTGCQLTWAPDIIKRVLTQHDVVFADLTATGTDRRGRMKKTMPSVAARDDELAAKLMEAQDLDLPLIVLANYDLLQWKQGTQPKMVTLFGIRFDAVVIDESHLVLPTQKDHPKEVTQFWNGLLKLPIAPDAIRLSISGTPDRGKLHQRYGHWKFLHPESHMDYWSWCKSEFVVSYNEVGFNPRTGRPVMVPEIGKMRSPERWAMYDKMRMIRRTKQEMFAGLPEKRWADNGGIDLPMTAIQKNAYLDFQADMEAKREALIADEQEGKAQGLKLQFTLRSRQMATCTWDFQTTTDAQGKEHTHAVPKVAGPASSNKLAWILEWMSSRGYLPEDFDPAGGKVVIVSYLTEVLNWLQQELANAGVHAEVMSGETAAPDKKRIEDSFQTGDLRIILLSGYLGVSINLDAADDMIFVDSVHDPDKLEQAEDRIHRASRHHQVTYYRLASIDTVDIAILQIVDQSYRDTRHSYDGARGVEFARLMLTGTPREMSAA